ncbi:MAG: DUF4292 domain-containing protein [Paramuribaculum sp.]|nr:DUF4292 domain-containing protein [Paramuribaculum sp.]
MKRIAIRILSVLLLLVALYGCGGKKQAENVVPNTDTSGNIGATDVLNHGQGVEYLKNTCVNYLPWQQVRVPVSVKINSPKSLSISGTAEMVRNKSVLISLKFIGMEVAWLYVSDDVVVVADKMNKRYISESSSKFLGGFDVNTANLQDLLIGRPFVLGSEDISSVDTNRLSFVSDGGEGWSLQPLSEIENLEYVFWFEPMTVLNAAVVQYASKQPVALLYGAPVGTPSGSMASHVGIKANIGVTNIDATLFWSWQKAKWDDSFAPREPKVPDNYRKVDGASVLKSLTGI